MNCKTFSQKSWHARKKPPPFLSITASVGFAGAYKVLSYDSLSLRIFVFSNKAMAVFRFGSRSLQTMHRSLHLIRNLHFKSCVLTKTQQWTHHIMEKKQTKLTAKLQTYSGGKPAWTTPQSPSRRRQKLVWQALQVWQRWHFILLVCCEVVS